jgi:hypothetical protein
MRPLLLLFAASSLSWSQVADLPNIGEKFEIYMRDGYLAAFSRRLLVPYVNRSYAGINFRLAVNSDEFLVFISTQDPNFRTPEHLGVGATSNEVFAAGGGAIVNEPGFPPYSPLPSGWCAQFPERSMNCVGFSLPDAPETLLVTGFFKRSSSPA